MGVNETYSQSYRDVAIHKLMLQDVVRTEAYESALRKAVVPGSRVLDFGCGTGVLSIFASRFGAERVFAVDRSEFIQAAHDIARRNGITNIEFHHDDSESVKIDSQVDLVVSEWMGRFLFQEAMLGPLLRVRDKFLAAGGVMIPGKVSLHAGLVCDKYFYDDLSFLRRKPYGIDFSPIADSPLRQTSFEDFSPKQILKATVDLGTFDLHTLREPPEVLEGVVVPDRKATIYGLCGWFSAELTEGIRLGTGPDDPPTHWGQLFFPFDEPFRASPDRELSVRIELPSELGPIDPTWRWSIEDSQQAIEMNDLDHRKRLDPNLPRGIVGG